MTANVPFPQAFVDADLTVPRDLEGAVEKPYKDYKVCMLAS